MKKILVSLIDDHPLILSGLQQLIDKEEDMKVLELYQSGPELLKALETRRPDVLLLDIHLPDMSGDEIAQHLSRKFPQVKIIVLSNLDYPYYIKNLLHSGIMGYILKSSKKDRILNAIREVHKGNQYIDESIAEKVREYQRSLKHQENQPLLLTKREKEILILIAKDLTSHEIAEKLYLSKRTVDTHRNNLLLKLDVKNSAGLIKKAIDLGLLK